MSILRILLGEATSYIVYSRHFKYSNGKETSNMNGCQLEIFQDQVDLLQAAVVNTEGC
jgi:hypothetical protein